MLYIVSTPIGNLEDITFRALRVLREADYILAEDTRRSGKLLSHYNIQNRLVSFNDINKKGKTKRVIEDLKQAKSIALVSDSGTPCISDPGFYLVRECIKNNIEITSVPGPSSVISALVCSGLATDKFTFYGFIPKNKSKRLGLFDKIKVSDYTSVLFESPYRIKKTLIELSELMPEKRIVIARELTKKFEEYIRGKAIDLLEEDYQGELVLLIEGKITKS